MNHKEFSEYTHRFLDDFRIPHKMRHKMLNIRPDIKRTRKMIVSVKRGDVGKVFDCNGKHIDESIIECNLLTGEAVRQILDEHGNPQTDPENPNESWKENVVYENTPLAFERF